MLFLTGVLLPLAGIALPPLIGWGLSILQQRTKIQLNEQQRQVILGAAQTAAGEILSGLSRGALTLNDITPGSQAVVSVAQRALDAVPDAASFHGVNLAAMARLVVGTAGRLLSADPTVPTSTALPPISATGAPPIPAIIPGATS